MPVRDALQALIVQDESRAGYERSKFKHWTDADSNGCNTRAEVLPEEAVTAPAVGPNCVLTGGSWYSPEVGRVIRTVQLLRYLSDTPLLRRVTAATNEVEAFNGFSQWIGFGNGGVITDNDPVEQEKTAKFNAPLTNAVIFHNALDIAELVRQLQEEGHVVDPEDLAHISPYLTEHIRRFGEYSTHELGLEPKAYDPHLDVDFSTLRGDGPGADGYGQAA